MSIRNIITLKENEFFDPSVSLRRPSVAVTEFDSNLRGLVADLTDTLNNHSIAVGLSAPQIGVKLCVAVVNIKKKDGKDPLVLINPKVTNSSERAETRLEACMSLPFFQGEVERPVRIRASYLDPEGNKREIKAEGFLARVLLHEIDHLNGVLYVDRMKKGHDLVKADFFEKDKHDMG